MITATFWWNDVNGLYRVSPHPSAGWLQETGWRTWVWRLPTPHKTRRSPASVPSHIYCPASPPQNLWRVNKLVTWLFTNSLLWHYNNNELIISICFKWTMLNSAKWTELYTEHWWRLILIGEDTGLHCLIILTLPLSS